MIEKKSDKLDSILRGLKSAVIAFSGGLDSSFLLYRASTIKKLRYVGVTITTSYMPDKEINDAIEFAHKYSLNHKILNFSFPEEIRDNPPDRCYLCKRYLFSSLADFAKSNNFEAILDGTNADDVNEYRPGLKALTELHIKSPLLEAGLTKQEIRELSRKSGLPVSEKPAMACLLTRLPYNTRVTEDILRKVEEAENILFEFGCMGARVRVHGDLARIECLPGYIEKIIHKSDREYIVSSFKKLGFRYVSLDLEGYRPESSNLENRQI